MFWGLGFRVLGFWGFGVLGFWGIGFRILGFEAKLRVWGNGLSCHVAGLRR